MDDFSAYDEFGNFIGELPPDDEVRGARTARPSAHSSRPLLPPGAAHASAPPALPARAGAAGGRRARAVGRR